MSVHDYLSTPDWQDNTGITPALAPDTVITVELRNDTFITDYLSTFDFSTLNCLYDIKRWKISTENPKVESALNKQVSGDHYKSLAIQPVEFIHANNIPYMEANVIKYVTRWRSKNGIADLEKAKHYIELLVELESKK